MKVYVGGLVRIKITCTDFDGSLFDPDSNTLEIYNAEKALVDTVTTDIIRESLGVFHFDYSVPSDSTSYGTWKVVWQITKNGLSDVSETTFDVVSLL
jgi:hypothetical protein